MNKPFLSISIPTYNRAEYLRESFSYIYAQLEADQILDQVEVAISDNGGHDNTREVVQEYNDKYGNIVYSRNETNLGYDRNVDRVLTIATGEFAWLLSDDEVLLPGSISRIIKLLKGNPDVGYVCISSDAKLYNTNTLNRHDNGNDYIKTYGYYGNGGLISSNIYKKSYLPVDRSKYFGSQWIHFAVTLEIVKDHKLILISNDSYFRDTESKHARKWSWRDNGNGIFAWLGLKKIINDLVGIGYDRAIVKKLDDELCGEIPKNLISAKLFGLKADKALFQRLNQELKGHLGLKLLVNIILITPNYVFVTMKKIYDILFK